MNIDTEIENIIFSGSNDPEKVQQLLCFSNSFSRLYNYFRYINERRLGRDMEPQSYWQSLADAYINSDNNKQSIPTLKVLFTQDIPGRRYLMNDQEQEVFNSLPDTVTIYRGMTIEESYAGENDPSEYGVSWTLEKSVAEFFANGYIRNFDTAEMEKTIVKREVPKKELIAYFDDRKEREVIYIPTESQTI